MTALVKLLVVLALFPGLCGSVQKSEIVFNTTEWDFGSIDAENGPVTYHFKVKNFGNETVRIGSLNPSCTCVIGKMEDKVLSPGEEGEIEFIFNPSGTMGKTFRTLDVFADNDEHLAMLSIYADVQVPLSSIERQYPIILTEKLLADKSLLSFGYVHWGEESSRTVGIVNSSDKTVELKVEVEGSPDAPLCLDYPERLKAGERAEIELKYSVPENYGKYGSFSNSIVVFADGTRAARKIETSCIVLQEQKMRESRPSMWTTPSLAKMKYRKSRKVYSGEIKLGNSGKVPLKVLSVQTDAKTNLAAGTVIPPGKTIVVELQSASPEARIEVFTDDPVRPYKELMYKYDK